MTDAANPSFITHLDLPFPPAERFGAKVEYFHFLPHDKAYTVDVHFLRQAPDAATIDRVLRECLALAAAHDGRFRISGSAYLVPGDDIDVHERQDLLPWGQDCFLCFDPQRRQIGVCRYGHKQFEAAQPITAVAAVGRGDNVHYPDRPVNPVYEGADMDEELDEATSDMRALVSEWIWYGHARPEVIDGWIEENAEAGDGFDLAWIQAFAVRALARKRAAEARWPAETDNDRLERAFLRLHEQGICAVHWAGHDMQEGEEAVADELEQAAEGGVPEGHYWGCCFYHSQDMDAALNGEGLRLAYGALASDEEADTVRAGQVVVAALRQEGLAPAWNGRADSRIQLPTLRWQRRTPMPE